jgi:hypothetical protein
VQAVTRHGWLLGSAAACVVVLVALAIWQGMSYVEYSDGVYADSAHLVLHGMVPYRDFAAAQPPAIYYAGPAVLAVLGDSIEGLRRGLAVVDLVLALLVVLIVLRLTGRRSAASIAGVVALVTPWALHEHAQLVPETFGAPLLLGAMLAAGERRSSALAGVAGAAAAFFKAAFILPAAAIAVAAAAPGLALLTLITTTLLGLAASALVFGVAFWRGAFEAQAQTGVSSVHYTAGLWAQAAWNLLPLAVPAVISLRERARAHAQPLFRVVVAGAVGSLLLLFSLFKRGSYLSVLVVIEPPLLILAACGWTWLLARRPLSANRPAILATTAAAALGVAQITSLLISPQNPRVFARPLSATTPGLPLGSAEVKREVRSIDRCPTQIAYSGPPFLAFAAGRRMPGSQPDQFIIEHAAADSSFRNAADRDQPRCP